MPTISVVIPTYNEERHIKRCIEPAESTKLGITSTLDKSILNLVPRSSALDELGGAFQPALM